MNSQQLELLSMSTQPPQYCAYLPGPCDRDFSTPIPSSGLFLYPSDPRSIASVVEEAATAIAASDRGRWLTWKDLNIGGNIIFCEICKAMRFTRQVIADVTTLNFNVMFEIGYAVGLGKPVLPIRDQNYSRDNRLFTELGLFDTLGYADFRTSSELSQRILSAKVSPIAIRKHTSAGDQDMYFVKSQIESNGQVRLLSIIKKSGISFRTHDPIENVRLSLDDAVRSVFDSAGVVVHLMDPQRTGAAVNNARGAFVAGIALAAEKAVLMLQEGAAQQPIDYRDLVKRYDSADQIHDLVAPFLSAVVEARRRARRTTSARIPENLLERVDLGELAAENEIRALRDYFVATAQFKQVERGHARLVVGRKGAGKTAVFYGVREQYWRRRSHLVLDLRPDGHQFEKLRDTVLDRVGSGSAHHFLVAMWEYLLLTEIARKVLLSETGQREAYRAGSERRARFDELSAAFGQELQSEAGDFSERLLTLVDSVASRAGGLTAILQSGEITKLIYDTDIRSLRDGLIAYLSVAGIEATWLLLDNLDKGWPILSSATEHAAILNGLLDAAQKVGQRFEASRIEFKPIVFIRSDIYHLLLRGGADRGKDTPASLVLHRYEP